MSHNVLRAAVAGGFVYVGLACLCTPSHAEFTRKKVGETTGKVPEFRAIDVSDPARFLNDLKLSPLWKVERDPDGTFIAKARSTEPEFLLDRTGRMFLFELMTNTNKTLPKDYRIHDRYLDGGSSVFSCFQVAVVFRRPKQTGVALGASGKKVTLPIYESFEGEIGPNSSSELVIKLSSQYDIYVILHEQGADPTRSTTFAKIPLALKEIASVAESPERYRVEERYAEFFRLFCPPTLKDHELHRYRGLQDRDTFYGYFRAQPNTSYSGINIKITHPVYCPDEGTRKHERLAKAEYLGTPHYDKDILFFLIEDNAVYLSGKYDQRFGTATGKESFDGNLEILNDKGEVLLRTTEKFKGWQR